MASKKLSLHGLGFIQLELTPHMRLHVWHPDLPRRRCFAHSWVHDHRFTFESRVLAGSIVDHSYTLHEDEVGGFDVYRHDGPRGEHGNRGWRRELGSKYLQHVGSQRLFPSDLYRVNAYEFHSTEVPDGRAATLMRKLTVYERGARSLCAKGIPPDTEFDRFQMTDDEMWMVIREVLWDMEP